MTELTLTHAHKVLVNKNINNSGIFEVEQGRQQRQAVDRILPTRLGQSQRAGQQRTAHAKTKRIDFFRLGNVFNDFNSLQDAGLQIVGPCSLQDAVFVAWLRVTP